jgi:hypothetical protein
VTGALERANAFASWELHHSVFEPDAMSLRDIYVLDTKLEDWRPMLELVLGRYPGARITRAPDGELVDVPIPDDLNSLFDSGYTTCLQFAIAELELFCNFFGPAEIELWFAWKPATEASLRPLLAFLIELGDATGREVIVTPENCQQAPYFRYEPTGQRLTYYPATV